MIHFIIIYLKVFKNISWIIIYYILNYTLELFYFIFFISIPIQPLHPADWCTIYPLQSITCIPPWVKFTLAGLHAVSHTCCVLVSPALARLSAHERMTSNLSFKSNAALIKPPQPPLKSDLIFTWLWPLLVFICEDLILPLFNKSEKWNMSL